jgi:hypothetical protein
MALCGVAALLTFPVGLLWLLGIPVLKSWWVGKLDQWIAEERQKMEADLLRIRGQKAPGLAQDELKIALKGDALDFISRL